MKVLMIGNEFIGDAYREAYGTYKCYGPIEALELCYKRITEYVGR